MDEFAVLYREAAIACRMSPPEVDVTPLWEMAAALGRNEPEPREEWPEGAPSLQTMRRYHALSTGTPVPSADDPVSDDEYAVLLADAKAGTRKEVNRGG